MSDTDAILALFDPSQRAHLRRRARQHGSTVADELRRLVSRDMDNGGRTAPPGEGCEEIEGDPIKERILAETGGPIEGGLAAIAGMFKGPDKVTSENFHDYLYGRWEDDE